MAQVDFSHDCDKEGEIGDQTVHMRASIQFLELKSQFFICQTGPCIHTDVYTFLMC